MRRFHLAALSITRKIILLATKSMVGRGSILLLTVTNRNP
jgi:hypothetical protein